MQSENASGVPDGAAVRKARLDVLAQGASMALARLAGRPSRRAQSFEGAPQVGHARLRMTCALLRTRLIDASIRVEHRKRSTSRSNPGADMTTNNPQLPWTDEQWARVNQVIHEEASRARVAATFLPLIGPLPGTRTSCGRNVSQYPACHRGPATASSIAIDDRHIWQLATLQVNVALRGAQIGRSGDDERADRVPPRRQRARSSRGRCCLQGIGADPTHSDRSLSTALFGRPPDVWKIGGASERERALGPG